jgi:hypothetical protein
MRANGGLGSNWAEPDGGGCPVQIISDLVYSTCISTFHPSDIWVNGTFNSNQYSSFIVASGTSTGGGQAAFLRGSTTSQAFYNDGFNIGSTQIAIGDAQSTDFCVNGALLNAYSAGDTHELDVASGASYPVFFWSKRNGNVDATCVLLSGNGQFYAGGYPGLGMSDDVNSKPTLADGAWTGGSLPSLSTAASDNFQRANSGWLGVNWWMDTHHYSGAAETYLQLNSNAASLNTSGSNGICAAVWTTPFSSTQASTVTLGNLTSGDWIGALARYSMPTAGWGNDGNGSYYFAIWSGGTLTLFAWTGSPSHAFESLASASVATQPTTIELDASGTSPVSLTVKVNGTTAITYSDSTYMLTGTYAGFTIYGHSTSTVTGWSGANL